VRAALVAHDGVDLVDDHRLRALQDRAPALRRQEEVQRLGRRDQHVGRAPDDLGAIALRRVSRAQRRADGRDQRAEAHRRGFDPAERCLEVALHVGAEGLERRDIDDARAIVEPTLERAAHQAVDAGEEGGQRLARSRRCHDERVAPGGDLGPTARLCLRRRAEALAKPGGDRGMKGVEHT
jgi:hypothetical protein